MEIWNNDGNNLISGTSNDDTIYSSENYKNVTIDAKDGNDVIWNNSPNSKIIAGNGNDSILNAIFTSDGFVTIDGGLGDDTLDSYARTLYQYSNGDGNDVIVYSPNDTIQLLSGIISNLSIEKSHPNYPDKIDYYDVILHIDNGSLRLSMSADEIIHVVNSELKHEFYTGNSNFNPIGNVKSNTIVSGTSNNDHVYNESKNVTINADSGNNKIENYYASQVLINSGSGNDTIYNSDSDYVTINSGYGDDSINNGGNNVSIYAGGGNDKIFNVHNDNVVTHSGDGNDTIYAYSRSYKKSKVTLNGGSDNDMIVLSTVYSSASVDAVIEYSLGEGNDTIQGFDTTDIVHIISGNINNASLNGNDVIIKVGDGSIKLSYAKDKKISVIDSQGKMIEFTNNYQGSDNDSNEDGDTKVTDDGKINNSKSNVTINGTASVDNIYNNGDNVWINGLAGGDYIVNILPDSTGIPRSGNNVTINGGKGNDKILCKATDTIIYAAGDGNDTVESYSGSKIKLKSGTFKGSSLNKSDVVLKIGGNDITLKNAKGKNIKLEKPNGKVISFKNNYAVKYYGRTVGANQTITAIDRDNFAGESISGANGSATIEAGDKLTKDSKGNISKIRISDKTHQITTSIKRTLSLSTVEIQDPNGKKIANITGATNIYWNDKGRIVIEAVDKNKSITVETFADNVDVTGSNKSDRIISKGKKANIDSGLGNDTIDNKGTAATIIGGKDNDTVSGNIGTLKLSAGTVKNASLKGSNFLVTTSYDDNVITLKNANNKQISVVSSNGKLTFKNNYAGDPKYWSSEAEALFKKAESEFQEQIEADIKSTETLEDTTKNQLITDIKSSLNVISGNLDDVPAAVYTKIATKIINSIDNSALGTLDADEPTSWITNVADMISQLGTDSETVKVGSTTYKIEYNKQIAGQTGSALITVTKGSKNVATMNWIDSKKHQSQAIKNYLNSLSDLNEKVWRNVITGLVKDAATTAIKLSNMSTYAKKIAAALISGDPIDLGKDLKSAIEIKAKSTFEKFVKSLPHGTQIWNAASKLKTVKSTYESIKNEAKNYKTAAESKNAYSKLEVAYSTFKNALNSTKNLSISKNYVERFFSDDDNASSDSTDKLYGEKNNVVNSSGKETSKIYGNTTRNFVEEHWFTEDNNFLNDEIELVMQDKIINSAVGKITTFDVSLDKQFSSLSSITYNQNRKAESTIPFKYES